MKTAMNILTSILLITFCCTFYTGKADGQSYIKPIPENMQWWQEARFGLFIHWSPVSLKGTEIGWSRGNQVPVDEYDNLYKQFNPIHFNADEWVSVAKSAGMKYVVITSKHHDGFCLWDTATTPYNIMSTPFKRDVIRELSDACRKEDIRFCTYYSILDWYHPDYNISSRGGPGYSLPAGKNPDMNRYETYMKAHLRELITNYGPLGVMWFDGEWEDPWTHDRGQALYRYVSSLQPGIIINNRVDKGRKGMEGSTGTDQDYAGDFDTPEQQVGTFQTSRPWETCMTICRQWAWKPDDELKSLKECIHILVNTAGGDGNLLLNVGPMPSGAIEPRQVERLKEIGDWLAVNGESIYGTRGGPVPPKSWGVTTHKGNTLYIHVLSTTDHVIALPKLSANIRKVSLIDGTGVDYESTELGTFIKLPERGRDLYDTVVVCEFDGVPGL